MKMSSFTVPILATLALSACAGPGAGLKDRPIASIDSQIDSAVATSASVTQSIAEVEVAVTRPASAEELPPNVVLPPDAVQPVTVDWNGGVEAFLSKMAARANYDFRVTGNRPANEVMINLTANEEPLFGVMRRAGLMVDGFATINFNPTSKVVELKYGA